MADAHRPSPFNTKADRRAGSLRVAGACVGSIRLLFSSPTYQSMVNSPIGHLPRPILRVPENGYLTQRGDRLPNQTTTACEVRGLMLVNPRKQSNIIKKSLNRIKINFGYRQSLGAPFSDTHRHADQSI